MRAALAAPVFICGYILIRGRCVVRKKVTVVGAGNVGASLVQRIAETGLADVVMVDVVEGVPQGKGLDLLEAGPVLGYDAKVTGTNKYDETANSDIIVITAGLARKPGMSRDDLLAANGDIVKKVAQETGSRSPNAVMIVVTNPMDVMAYVAMKATGFPARAGDRHGRRARFRALPDVHRDGTGRVRGKHPCLRARRPRRLHGAAAALFHGRRHPDHRADERGHDQQAGRADAERRRGDRGPAQDRERLLCAVRVDARDGRGHPARQKEDPSLFGLARRRVRSTRAPLPACRSSWAKRAWSR